MTEVKRQYVSLDQLRYSLSTNRKKILKEKNVDSLDLTL